MKISINNFKNIRDLNDFEIKPINVISGVNSSGKTSFIQLLLLLKQSIEIKTVDKPLFFENEFIQLGGFNEVIYRKDLKNKLEIRILFTDDEFEINEAKHLEIKQYEISVTFVLESKEVVVDSIKIDYSSLRKHYYLQFTRTKDKKYSLNYISPNIFNTEFDKIYEDSIGDLFFTAFMPQIFNTEDINKNKISIKINIKKLQDILESEFNNMNYIGPLRETPRDSYSANKKNKNIGSKGEYAAYFLEKEATNPIQYYKIENLESEQIKFIQVKGKLIDAVKYWICDVFKLAKDMRAEEYKDEYIIWIVNKLNIETTIKHVGFGVSQVLPIIVEGLRFNNYETLILEQPEIHLHPKVQSSLFDFLYSLTLKRKKIIVETHSDHFITRMRRRVAEDKENKLLNEINFVFVEEAETGHIFRRLDLSKMGSLNYFPKDFVEQSSKEYKAIVKAQAIKRVSERND